jgi:ribonuclease P protein component
VRATGAATHLPPQLSTDEGAAPLGAVDDTHEQVLLQASADAAAPLCPMWRLGLVLPKKQARRSVTRSLIRHQAREALRRHAPAVHATGRFGAELDGWVLRLKTPFDRQHYPSAASSALQVAVREELDELWSRLIAARPEPSAKRAAVPAPQGGA